MKDDDDEEEDGVAEKTEHFCFEKREEEVDGDVRERRGRWF